MLVFVSWSAAAVPVFKEKPATQKEEAEYYRLATFAIPREIVLEAGALELLPDGRLAVGTRRGEIWMVANPEADDPPRRKFTRFAHGLHEVLGLAYQDGWLYVTQRCELSRIKDSDGDGKADVFETVSDAWEINGDYHEYAFGSQFDNDGNIWVALCLTGSFTSESKFRGWGLRITSRGQDDPDVQRHPLARRRRHERRGRHLLHRQPGPLERRLRPEAAQTRRVPGQPGGQPLVR